MAIKIAAMLQKGGVSKTSSVQTIASILAFNGAKVLILDFDQQDNQKQISGVRGKHNEGIADIIINGYTPTDLVHSVRDNIDLILSGGKALSGVDDSIKSGLIDSGTILDQRLKDLEDKYDYILIDTSPYMSPITMAVVSYADYIYMPVDMDLMSYSAVRNVIHFLETYEEKTTNKVAKILGVIPQFVDLRRLADNTVLDDFYALAQNKRLREGIVFSPISQSANMKTAQIRRKFLIESFPKGKITQEWQKVVSEILTYIQDDNKSTEPQKQPSQSV